MYKANSRVALHMSFTHDLPSSEHVRNVLAQKYILFILGCVCTRWNVAGIVCIFPSNVCVFVSKHTTSVICTRLRSHESRSKIHYNLSGNRKKKKIDKPKEWARKRRSTRKNERARTNTNAHTDTNPQIMSVYGLLYVYIFKKPQYHFHRKASWQHDLCFN